MILSSEFSHTCSCTDHCAVERSSETLWRTLSAVCFLILLIIPLSIPKILPLSIWLRGVQSSGCNYSHGSISWKSYPGRVAFPALKDTFLSFLLSVALTIVVVCIVFSSIFFHFVFWDRVSLRSSSWPCSDPPFSVYQVLVLQGCATTPT